MRNLILPIIAAALLPMAHGAVLTVTTTDNVTPPAGQLSLAQAIAQAADGDQIRFNIPGAGPHYIVTPPSGYPEIRRHNLVIDGYSQPGSAPNTNPILATNSAQIKVFLDSRNGGSTVLDYDGYGTSESAILGIVGATNVTVRGLGFLAHIVTQTSDVEPAIYCISFAAKATHGHVNGCWFGVDADRTTVAGANAGITGFRFREDGIPFLSDFITVGVAANATNAPAQFNVITGMKIPVIVEGQNLRVSGNFINVLPNGIQDVNIAYSDLPNEGAIQVGRHGGGTLIGTDGDGVNDANERNIIGGTVPRFVDAEGYHHTIEFYGGGPRTNVVVAGNYIGVGIDGVTRFTNGVPVLSGQTGTARVGSDFDGVSDAIEGNLIFNNYPSSIFTPDAIVRDFLDNVGTDAVISLRGNVLVNNFTPPVSPLRDDGNFITNYYSKALISLENGIVPVLSTNTSTARLIGTAPIVDTNFFYVATIIDLYIPDPEGLTNSVPELPNGFIQGRTYLASFVDNSNADLNPALGFFEFDISALKLPLGTPLTVTANFTQEPPGTRNAPTLTTLFSDVVRVGEPVFTEPPPVSISKASGSVTVSWSATGFTLQSAPTVAGPWTRWPQTASTNSFTAQITGAAQFFRLTQ